MKINEIKSEVAIILGDMLCENGYLQLSDDAVICLAYHAERYTNFENEDDILLIQKIADSDKFKVSVIEEDKNADLMKIYRANQKVMSFAQSIDEFLEDCVEYELTQGEFDTTIARFGFDVSVDEDVVKENDNFEFNGSAIESDIPTDGDEEVQDAFDLLDNIRFK